VTAVVAALIWHFGRYRRKMMKEKKQLEKLSKFVFKKLIEKINAFDV
jgi:hypothetical protein